MGMFDTVKVPCPECGTISEFQSKGGDCIGWIYGLGSAPPDVLGDVNRHAPNTCEKCNAVFRVQVQTFVSPILEEDALKAAGFDE